ncbi:hypothetical protein ACFFIX_06795 [Metabacillus herbersteinensis]|uniref:DUF2268 domain-containing protein n=1 Tax=Metabacillus herbersteinensis TaxID=283816 RepID=A0ABV6GBW4_9BACI
MKTTLIICWNLLNSILMFAILSTLFVFVFLFVDNSSGFVAGAMLFLVVGGLFCVSIYGLVQWGKKFKFLFFRSISGAVMLMLTSVSLFLSLTVIFFINYMLLNEFGHSMTFQDKIDLYSSPFKNTTHSPKNYQSLKSDRDTLELLQHVTVYHLDEEKGIIPIIEDALKEAILLNNRVFGEVENPQVDLLLHSTSAELTTYTSMVDTMGYYDESRDMMGVAINNYDGVLSKNEAAYYYFYNTIMHEYTHYRMQTFIKENGLYLYRVPIWFHEGVAEYIGMNGVRSGYYPFEEVNLTGLSTHEQWDSYRSEEFDVYTQGHFAVLYLVDTYGEDIVSMIITETAKLNDFEKGFKKATGISVNELNEVYLIEEKKMYEEM